MRRTLLPALSAVLLLCSCAADDGRAAMRAYIDEEVSIGADLAETGARFETLMNGQGEITAWTEAERGEIRAILEEMDALVERAEDMDPPDIAADAHPLLVQAVTEMRSAIGEVETIAGDPAAVTEEAAARINAHASEGKRLGDEYLARLQAAAEKEYPGMLGG